MDVFLISRLPTAKVGDFIRDLRESAGPHLGPEYELTVRSVVEAGNWATVVSYGRNRNHPLPEMLFYDRDLIYVFSGYVVDTLASDTNWRHFFGPEASTDERPVTRSPGGIYSYATVRRSDGQVSAGHSTPTLEPLYYSQGDGGFHIGNHPLIVHSASRDFEPPLISEMFFLRAVGAGVAIDDHTPFVGTKRLSPGEFVASRDRRLHIIAASEPSFGSYRVRSTKQRIDAVTEALLQAGSILERLPRGEFRLSGGKDSRILAALIKARRIPVDPVNQNFPQEVEGQVADRVAATLGMRCDRTPIEDYVDRDLVRATTRKIVFAGGLPAAASTQYPNRSEGRVPGTPLVMGHAHLQRGGFANNQVRLETEAVAVAKARTVSGLLLPGFAEHNDLIVNAWIDDQLRGGDMSAQVISFTAYLQYTLNYLFQSLYAYVRNWNLLVTPMVDERFALLCKQIAIEPAGFLPGSKNGITDLRGERVAMGVVEALAPELLEFPLAEDRYRADRPGRPGYESRNPALLARGHIPEEDLRRIFNTRRLSGRLRGEIWEQVEGGRVARLAEEAVRPEVWNFVSNPKSEPPAEMSRVSLSLFAMSVLGYSIIQDTDWWRR